MNSRYDRARREFVLDVIIVSDHEKGEVKKLVVDERESKPLHIRSAKFPYNRIELGQWVGSLIRLLDVGLNTIEIDVEWSAHEPVEGHYDLTRGNNDLVALLELAEHFGLFVLVRLEPIRIGDHSTDLGGLPSWLLDDYYRHHHLIRHAFERFLDVLLPVLAPYQLARNGPIIAFVSRFLDSSRQPSNSILSLYDQSYLDFLGSMFYRHGIVEILLKSVSLCELDRKLDAKNYLTYCDPSLYIYLPINELNNIPTSLDTDVFLGSFLKNKFCFLV